MDEFGRSLPGLSETELRLCAGYLPLLYPHRCHHRVPEVSPAGLPVSVARCGALRST